MRRPEDTASNPSAPNAANTTPHGFGTVTVNVLFIVAESPAVSVKLWVIPIAETGNVAGKKIGGAGKNSESVATPPATLFSVSEYGDGKSDF